MESIISCKGFFSCRQHWCQCDNCCPCTQYSGSNLLSAGLFHPLSDKKRFPPHRKQPVLLSADVQPFLIFAGYSCYKRAFSNRIVPYWYLQGHQGAHQPEKGSVECLVSCQQHGQDSYLYVFISVWMDFVSYPFTEVWLYYIFIANSPQNERRRCPSIFCKPGLCCRWDSTDTFWTA